MQDPIGATMTLKRPWSLKPVLSFLSTVLHVHEQLSSAISSFAESIAFERISVVLRKALAVYRNSMRLDATANFVSLCSAVFKEPTLSMLSRSQEYHLLAGAQINLDCEFYMESFHFFDNPTIWMKSQGEDRTTINVMVMIQEPFSSTGRFDVSLIRHQPRYRLVLKIKGTWTAYDRRRSPTQRTVVGFRRRELQIIVLLMFSGVRESRSAARRQEDIKPVYAQKCYWVSVECWRTGTPVRSRHKLSMVLLHSEVNHPATFLISHDVAIYLQAV